MMRKKCLPIFSCRSSFLPLQLTTMHHHRVNQILILPLLFFSPNFPQNFGSTYLRIQDHFLDRAGCYLGWLAFVSCFIRQVPSSSSFKRYRFYQIDFLPLLITSESGRTTPFLLRSPQSTLIQLFLISQFFFVLLLLLLLHQISFDKRVWWKVDFADRTVAPFHLYDLMNNKWKGKLDHFREINFSGIT